jgi:hypothetical protein
MSKREPSKDSAARGGLAALAVAAFAVLCCAAVPVLAALAGSIAIGVVPGVGAGLAAGVLLTVAVVARLRRRRRGRFGEPTLRRHRHRVRAPAGEVAASRLPRLGLRTALVSKSNLGSIGQSSCVRPRPFLAPPASIAPQCARSH